MNKQHFFKFALLACLSVSALNVNAESGALELSLNNSTLGDPQHLMLKEVADKQKTSSALLEKYGNVLLPSVGSAGVQPSQVLLSLSKAGAPMTQIKLVSPADQKITLSPKSEVLQQVREAIVKKVAQSNQVDEKSVLLELSEIPQDLPAPKSFSRLEVELSSPLARVNFFNDNGMVFKSSDINAKVLFRSSVLVAKKALMPTQVVNPSDFELKQQDLESVQGLVRSFDEIKDAALTLTQGIESGTTLKREYLQKATVLQKGALVNLISKNPQFQIQTLAKVKDLIGNGETVLVENLDSKKEVTAKAISSTEVEVIQ